MCRARRTYQPKPRRSLWGIYDWLNPFVHCLLYIAMHFVVVVGFFYLLGSSCNHSSVVHASKVGRVREPHFSLRVHAGYVPWSLHRELGIPIHAWVPLLRHYCLGRRCGADGIVFWFLHPIFQHKEARTQQSSEDQPSRVNKCHSGRMDLPSLGACLHGSKHWQGIQTEIYTGHSTHCM